MNFYIFRNKKMPWGDYGNTLLVGYAFPDENDETKILIERTGPFVPPVYYWSDYLLISNIMKQKLEQSDLKGFDYQKTFFHKVVDIDWTNWDLEADKPKLYPAGGEPENYIFTRKHNPDIANKMKPIWVLNLCEEVLIGKKDKDAIGRQNLFLIENSWKETDIFLAVNTGFVFLSEKAKIWFENNSDGFADFELFNSKVATQEEIAIVKDSIKSKPIKVNPFVHLTEKDWKNYQKFIEQANKSIAKSKTDKTNESKLTSINKTIESLKNAQQIRTLGKKEQDLLNRLTEQYYF
ncbi:hypothetical protein LZQ00_00890 [Sphingobacterium sp. SRCM116780]|uniref:hypothetical protein n=1 Tax=Sphingobacterium sp. SRCM116780 TaxID=2907623 RepID=UPI001F1FF763|nr:hypothetical protein [Sphingobacterium sp. SRCM116780]UIR56393.1 hypothetical protein LZQ00_00890 [Sphingobacterium sp. SRCM116780]